MNNAQILSTDHYRGRYALQRFATRFGTVEFFILDYEDSDLTGLPNVLFQTTSHEAAYDFILDLIAE